MASRMRTAFKLRVAFSAQSVAFPRLSPELVGLNWTLSRSLVTPFGATVLNGVGAGSKADFRAELKLGPVPKALHLAVAKEISRQETVFVEEGEFRGVLFRIVTGSKQLAAAARSVLTSTQAFEGGVTLLAQDAAPAQQAAHYDKTRKLAVAGGVSDALLQAIINDL